MGNDLSRNKIEAIETVQELWEQASPREIALHPVALCVQDRLDRANTEDRDVLLKAFGFPSQTRPKKRRKNQAETSHEQCPESEVPKAPSLCRDQLLRRAIRELQEAKQSSALHAELLRWKKKPDDFWHNQAQSIFIESSQGAAGPVSSIYSALHKLGKDDHVNAARRRCIVLMLVRVRDSIINNTPGVQHRPRGRGNKSHAVDWIAHSVSRNAERSSSEFIAARTTLASLLSAGTKYYQIIKTLGYGFIFLLGGMDTLNFWETKMSIDNIMLLSKQLADHPHITERAKSYNRMASQIIVAGLMKSGWAAWEAEQKAMLSTGNKYEKVATNANFFELQRPIPVDIGSSDCTTLPSLDDHLHPSQSDSAARSMLVPLTSGYPSNVDHVSLGLESTQDFDQGLVRNTDVSAFDLSSFQQAEDFDQSLVRNTDVSAFDLSSFQQAEDFDQSLVRNTDVSTVNLSSLQWAEDVDQSLVRDTHVSTAGLSSFQIGNDFNSGLVQPSDTVLG